MSHLEKLREKRRGAASVLFHFDRNFSETSREVYVFVEGEEDQEFYRPILEKAFPEMKIRLFTCAGKKEVKIVATKIGTSNQKFRRCLFFVDKDVDALCGRIEAHLDNMYETPCYAIENIVCTRQAFSSGLQKFMRLPDNDPIFVECMRIAEGNFCFLERSLLPVMALTIAARRMNKEINFSNFEPSKRFKLDKDGRISSNSPIVRDFVRTFSLDEISIQHLRAVRAELKEMRYCEWLRGKYLSWMFVNTFNKLWERFHKKETIAGTKIKINIQITTTNYMQIFDGRFMYPDCLIEFLKTMRSFISVPMDTDKIHQSVG